MISFDEVIKAQMVSEFEKEIILPWRLYQACLERCNTAEP